MEKRRYHRSRCQRVVSESFRYIFIFPFALKSVIIVASILSLTGSPFSLRILRQFFVKARKSFLCSRTNTEWSLCFSEGDSLSTSSPPYSLYHRNFCSRCSRNHSRSQPRSFIYTICSGYSISRRL